MVNQLQQLVSEKIHKNAIPRHFQRSVFKAYQSSEINIFIQFVY